MHNGKGPKQSLLLGQTCQTDEVSERYQKEKTDLERRH